jgi:hypothetical protein
MRYKLQLFWKRTTMIIAAEAVLLEDIIGKV